MERRIYLRRKRGTLGGIAGTERCCLGTVTKEGVEAIVAVADKTPG